MRRREALGTHKRLLYCVKITYTSLDHLLLGVVADIDKVSHARSIARIAERGERKSLRQGYMRAATRAAM